MVIFVIILFTGKQLTIFMNLSSFLQNYLLGGKNVVKTVLKCLFIFFFSILKEK